MMKIKIESFEGPLDLLLQLIEKEEMDITQISLAKIADEYVTYIQNSARINPDEMADFLVVAARLLLIKSRALLPYLYPEEEQEIEEFEQQLRMYKEFIEAAKGIQKMIGKKKFMFMREFNRKVMLSHAENMFFPPAKLTAGDMEMVYNDVINRIKPFITELEEERLEHKVRIEDKINTIQTLLLEKIKFAFSKVLSGANTKTDIIVSFLAILELSKQRELVVEQAGLFEEIYVDKYEARSTVDEV